MGIFAYLHPRPVRPSAKNVKPVRSEPVGWQPYFMRHAELAATKSKDSTKVGAVLVGPEGEIRLTGFNGPPRGVLDLPERFDRPAKYMWVSHAEANLIAFAAREGIRTSGCTVYTTHMSCSSCARTMIQAGVKCVIYGNGKTSMPEEEFNVALVMFAEAGIICEPVK